MAVDRICRLCLYKTPSNISLLNGSADVMLETLTSIKVNPNDEILMVCVKCYLNLKLAYSIQQTIIKADEKLRSGYLNTLMIKQEPNSVNTQDIPLLCLNKSENKFINCVICDLTLEENSVNSHVQQHFNNPQFCNLCDQNFTNIQSYRQHLQQHPKHEKYKCKKCKTTFFYKSLYNIHLEQAHPQLLASKSNTKKLKKGLINKLQKKLAQKLNLLPKVKKIKKRIDPLSPYTCSICLKKFDDKKQFRRHSHKRKPCPICKKNIMENNFSIHVRNHTNGPQICEQCGKTCKDVSSLKGHIFYMHKTKNYECKDCKISFKNGHSLRLHKKRMHSEPDQICETCGKKFFFSCNLKKHIKSTHLKERPYICEFCKRGFSRPYALNTHRRQHTNETPYKCEECGEGFRYNVSLKSHRKTKHNIIEEITCRCEICGKGFSSLHAVKTHMKCH